MAPLVLDQVRCKKLSEFYVEERVDLMGISDRATASTRKPAGSTPKNLLAALDRTLKISIAKLATCSSQTQDVLGSKWISAKRRRGSSTSPSIDLLAIETCLIRLDCDLTSTISILKWRQKFWQSSSGGHQTRPLPRQNHRPRGAAGAKWKGLSERLAKDGYFYDQRECDGFIKGYKKRYQDWKIISVGCVDEL